MCDYQIVTSDSRYEEAKNIVRETKNTGIAHLQRKMMIGYHRAAFFLEAMEKDKIVSYADRTGVRTFLET